MGGELSMYTCLATRQMYFVPRLNRFLDEMEGKKTISKTVFPNLFLRYDPFHNKRISILFLL